MRGREGKSERMNEERVSEEERERERERDDDDDDERVERKGKQIKDREIRNEGGV